MLKLRAASFFRTLINGFLPAFFLLAMVLTTACSKKDSPKEVAENFLSAFGKNEFEQAKQYGTEETDRLLDMMSGFNKMLPDSSIHETKFEIVSEKVEGNVATVMYKEAETQDAPVPMTLIREDGKWMVSMNKESVNAAEGEALDAGGTSTEAPADSSAK